VGGASGTFAVNKGTSKTEALSFLYDYDVMVIISINFRTGNTVSLLTFFIGENILSLSGKNNILLTP